MNIDFYSGTVFLTLIGWKSVILAGVEKLEVVFMGVYNWDWTENNESVSNQGPGGQFKRLSHISHSSFNPNTESHFLFLGDNCNRKERFLSSETDISYCHSWWGLVVTLIIVTEWVIPWRCPVTFTTYQLRCTTVHFHNSIENSKFRWFEKQIFVE